MGESKTKSNFFNFSSNIQTIYAILGIVGMFFLGLFFLNSNFISKKEFQLLKIRHEILDNRLSKITIEETITRYEMRLDKLKNNNTNDEEEYYDIQHLINLISKEKIKSSELDIEINCLYEKKTSIESGV